MQTLCILLPSLGVHVSFDNAYLQAVVFLVFSIPLALTFFASPLLWAFLSFVGRDLTETSHLGLRVPKSLTRFVMSDTRSLYLYICIDVILHLLQKDVSLVMAKAALFFSKWFQAAGHQCRQNCEDSQRGLGDMTQ